MKLDAELAREILVKIEGLPFDGAFHDITVDDRTDEEVTYHVMILDQSGLIENHHVIRDFFVCAIVYGDVMKSPIKRKPLDLHEDFPSELSVQFHLPTV